MYHPVFFFIVAILIAITGSTASTGDSYVNAKGKDFEERCNFALKCSTPHVLEMHAVNNINPNEANRFNYGLNCSGEWYHYTWIVNERNGTIDIKEELNNVSKIINIFNSANTNTLALKIRNNLINNEPIVIRSPYYINHKWLPPCNVICTANCIEDNEGFKSSSKGTSPPRMPFLLIWILVGLAVNGFY